jgi:hypothetical protein
MPSSQYFYIGNVFYAPVTFGTKISFVLLYLRIWKDSNMFFRRTCWAMVVVLICALISFEFSTILICESLMLLNTAKAHIRYRHAAELRLGSTVRCQGALHTPDCSAIHQLIGQHRI